jgi:hypothetical protein
MNQRWQPMIIRLNHWEQSLWNLVGSTQVPVCVRINAQRGTWDLPTPVKLERRHMTFTVLVWCRPQSNRQRPIAMEKLCPALLKDQTSNPCITFLYILCSWYNAILSQLTHYLRQTHKQPLYMQPLYVYFSYNST